MNSPYNLLYKISNDEKSKKIKHFRVSKSIKSAIKNYKKTSKKSLKPNTSTKIHSKTKLKTKQNSTHVVTLKHNLLKFKAKNAVNSMMLSQQTPLSFSPAANPATSTTPQSLSTPPLVLDYMKEGSKLLTGFNWAYPITSNYETVTYFNFPIKIKSVSHCVDTDNLMSCLSFKNINNEVSKCGPDNEFKEEYELKENIQSIKIMSTTKDNVRIIARLEIQLETHTLELGSYIVNEPNVYTAELCPKVNSCGNFDTYSCKCACGTYCDSNTNKCIAAENANTLDAYSNYLCNQTQWPLETHEIPLDANELRSLSCLSSDRYIENISMGLSQNLQGQLDLLSLSTPLVGFNGSNYMVYANLIGNFLTQIQWGLSDEGYLSYLKFLFHDGNLTLGNTAIKAENVKFTQINPFLLYKRVEVYYLKNRVYGLIFVDVDNVPVFVIGSLEKQVQEILDQNKPKEPVAAKPAEATAKASSPDSSNTSDSSGDTEINAVEVDPNSSATNESDPQPTSYRYKHQTEPRFKQTETDSDSPASSASTPASASTASSGEEVPLEKRDVSFEAGTTLEGLYAIIVRGSASGIDFLEFQISQNSTGVLSPLDDIYLSDEFNPVESYYLENVFYKSEEDRYLVLEEDYLNIYSGNRSKKELNLNNVAEMYAADAPVFTLGNTFTGANGQYYFYKIEGRKYKISNRALSGNQLLSVDSAGKKMSFDYSILNRQSEMFYIVPTDDGDSFNILSVRMNFLNNQENQYLSMDENGVNTSWVSTDTKDGRQRWLIKSLSGTVKSLNYDLPNGKYFNLSKVASYEDEYYNSTEITVKHKFNYNVNVTYNREFVYDHGHAYDKSNKLEVNSLVLSQDLKFVTKDNKRLFDLNTTNKVAQALEQSNLADVEPFTKSILKVYVSYYDILVPYKMDIQSNGVDKAHYSSYGNLKGKSYVAVLPEFTSAFLDGTQWVSLPKNYELVDIAFDFANASIKMKDKEEVYKFSYSNKAPDPYSNTLVNTILKQTTLKLVRTSGLYLKAADKLKWTIPSLADEKFVSSPKSYDMRMNVENSYPADVQINYNYVVKPFYRNDYTFYSTKNSWEIPYVVRVKDVERGVYLKSNGTAKGISFDKPYPEVDLYFFDGIDNDWYEHSKAYEIKDIVFLNDDVVLSGETSIVLGTSELENKTAVDSLKPVHFEGQYKGSYHFTHQTGFPMQSTDEIQKGIPSYAGGHFSLSPEQLTSYKFEGTQDYTYKVNKSTQITVYAFQKMKVTYTLMKAVVNIPYKIQLVDQITSKTFNSYGTFHADVYYNGDINIQFDTDLKNCMNRGKVLETKKGFLCDCDFGFGGYYCQDCVCDKKCVNGKCNCAINDQNERNLSCECEAGGDWTGEFCNVPTRAVEINGTKACIGGEKCLCLKGMYGPNCDIPINPPDCSGHGKLNIVHKCECDPGWYNPQCDCNISCQNDSICSANKCLCKEGYIGENCELTIDQKISQLVKCINNCSQNGKCKKGQCDCKEGFSGIDCSRTEKCQNGGLGVNGLCLCSKEFYGPKCDFKRCPKSCSNHGKCLKDGRCQCEQGFEGDYCDKEVCKFNCSNHGKCHTETDSPICKCDMPYFGEYCEKKHCDENCEKNGGICSESGECFCPHNATGEVCQIKQCPNSCNNHGYCGSDQTCVCDPEYMGEECDIQICKNNCSGHGLCIDTNFAAVNMVYRNTIKTRLLSKLDLKTADKLMDTIVRSKKESPKQDKPQMGYVPEDFVAPESKSVRFKAKLQNTIKNKTYQTNDGNELENEADSDLENVKESIVAKTPVFKPPVVDLFDVKSRYKCVCENGFTGKDCSVKICKNNCSGRGKCDFSDKENPKCICNAGFEGDTCEKIECPHGCSQNGHCNHLNGICSCKPIWQGKDCAQPKCPFKCLDRGVCMEGGHCQCADGFEGIVCEKLACPNNCSGEGTCSKGKCLCNEGFIGPDCSIKTCPNNCTSLFHGKCIIMGNQTKCVCRNDYFGTDCSQSSCEENCNNNGLCVNKICKCSEFWQGRTCKERRCYNSCSHRGECKENGVCACKEGYEGEFCERKKCKIRCFFGSCVNGDTCVCSEGYFGRVCNLKRCSASCMKHGKCDYINGTCKECDFGFEGPECEINLHLQCKHGLLLDGKKCRCFNGWAGTQCDQQKCELACLHGTCQIIEGQSVCSCQQHWTGKFCHVDECKSKCEYGCCNKDHKCECSLNYSGEYCDIQSDDPDI